jgi:glycosyltransferase involved in cell wall biosynthesis
VPVASHPITPLTIGIDARAASDVPAGRGRVVRELLRELNARSDPHSYRLYARRPWGELDSRFTWVTTAHRDPLWHLVVARRASRECDVFLSSNSNLTVWFTTVPTVLVVYDLVAFDRSLAPNRRSAVIEHLTLGVATRRAAAFLAISEATATALVARFPRCAGRTTVALLGAAAGLDAQAGERGGADAVADLRARELAGDGFVLAVGTLEPRKNLPRLVEAFRRLPTALQAAHSLVVVGASGWQMGETLRALQSLGDRARILGYVDDAELAELYRRCSVFCYPSLGEGFGLPVLEAMAAGAAVVTSNVSSLPEVGGDAVEYADPRDIDSICAALRRVLEDAAHRAELGRRGVARAARFSWTAFADVTLGVLERASTAGGRSTRGETR